MKKLVTLSLLLCITNSLLQAETKARRYALGSGKDNYHAGVYQKQQVVAAAQIQKKNSVKPLPTPQKKSGFSLSRKA